MSTINERRFTANFKAGMDKYKQAVDIKNPQNKIKQATAALKDLDAAFSLLTIIERRNEAANVNEFRTLCLGLIGTAYYELGDFSQAIDFLNKSMEQNKLTHGNQETVIRNVFFLERLMDIATKTNNITSAEEFAQKLFRIGESLNDLKIYAEVLLKVKKVFFDAKNVTWIEKSFDRLLKICKKGKNELKQTLALVHSEYGKYQELVIQNPRNAKKHYEEAIKIYKSLGLSKEITELHQTLEEMKKGKK